MSTAFVWEDVAPVTNGWHSNGGVLIVAKDLRAARFAWAKYTVANRLEREPEDEPALSGKPDHRWKLAVDYDDLVVVFPNAGCC